MIIQFVNRQSNFAVASWREIMRDALNRALLATPWPKQVSAATGQAQVTVQFTGPILMRRINRSTRGIDRLTDVLSYPFLEMQDGRLCRPIQVQDIDWTRPDRPVVLLGEILISPHQALRQAAELGQPIERELAFLAVHGLLHLLGYDHDLPRREQKMLRLQRRILLDTGKTAPLPASHAGAARPTQGTPQEMHHD